MHKNTVTMKWIFDRDERGQRSLYHFLESSEFENVIKESEV